MPSPSGLFSTSDSWDGGNGHDGAAEYAKRESDYYRTPAQRCVAAGDVNVVTVEETGKEGAAEETRSGRKQGRNRSNEGMDDISASVDVDLAKFCGIATQPSFRNPTAGPARAARNLPVAHRGPFCLSGVCSVNSKLARGPETGAGMVLLGNILRLYGRIPMIVGPTESPTCVA